MTRRPNNLLTQREIRARDARRQPSDAPCVSFNAVCGIIERECDKVGRRWWGTMTEVAHEINAIDPATRKEARQLVLDRLDRFPLRVAP